MNRNFNENVFLFGIFFILLVHYNNVQGLPISDPSVTENNRTDATHFANDAKLKGFATKNIDGIEDRTPALNFNVALQDDASIGAEADKTTRPTADIIVTIMKRSRRYWEPWQLNHIGSSCSGASFGTLACCPTTDICPPSLCTASEENRPRGTGGSVFYNGDIILDKESEQKIYGNNLRQRWWRRKRATMKSSRIWKDGIVPFIFAETISLKAKTAIKKAMVVIQNNTCIRFRRKKLRDEDYIRFISEPGCWSNVGKVGGEQKVSIGLGCERVGTAIHEISHSLGFWHEQARPDRDKYVTILEENISPRYLPDFDKANKTLVSSRGFPYDYESVMHYSKKAFTNIGDITIKVIGVGKKLNMQIGQRDTLSTIDIAQLRDMYNCNDKEDDNVTYCPKGWKKNGRKCYKFESKLREQFSGAVRHCEKLNSHLLVIDDSREDTYIRRQVKKKFPDVLGFIDYDGCMSLPCVSWRTAGRLMNGTFKWFTGDKQKSKEMTYTKWTKGHPSSFSSLALVLNKTKFRMSWQGVWLGSAKQLPNYAYAFICERRSKRKCIKLKHKNGQDYRGTLDHTIDGITCQKWSSQYPHSHQLLPYPYTDTGKPNLDGIGDHNHCRNPTKQRRNRPWCYTNKSKYKWQYCDISQCSIKSNANRKPKQEKINYNVVADAAADTRGLEKASNNRKGSSNKKEPNNRKGSNNKNNPNHRKVSSNKNDPNHREGSSNRKDSNYMYKKNPTQKNNSNNKKGSNRNGSNTNKGSNYRNDSYNKMNTVNGKIELTNKESASVTNRKSDQRKKNNRITNDNTGSNRYTSNGGKHNFNRKDSGDNKQNNKRRHKPYAFKNKNNQWKKNENRNTRGKNDKTSGRNNKRRNAKQGAVNIQ